MGTRLHNCSECVYLRRTSPKQVFLLCEFWARPNVPMRHLKAAGYTQTYIVLHCHMQPEALACPFFRARGLGTESTEQIIERLKEECA